jgi:hypothetical protein
MMGIPEEEFDTRIFTKCVECGGEIGDRYWQVGITEEQAVCCSEYCAMRVAEIEDWDNVKEGW